MFSGIGGFELGIEKAFDNKYAHIGTESQQEERPQGRERDTGERGIQLCVGDQPPLCIGFSEIDKYAIQIYQSHFKEHKNYGNARSIVPETIPDFDLLVGGFPCQSFSIAGKRGGLEDTRGTLFYEIARIAKVKRPQLLLLENVKGLLSHDKGNTFATILSTFDELGYDLQWAVLNSKNFGIPQNRERVFIVGHLRGTGRPKVFPIGECDKAFIEQPTGIPQQVASAIFASQHKIARGMTMVAQAQRVCNIDRVASTLQGEAEGQYDGSNIRRLTPIECERLQGFPDGWTEGVSDTQRYKCLGNAVTVNVIEAICENLFPTQQSQEKMR